jgi:thioredoxin 1
MPACKFYYERREQMSDWVLEATDNNFEEIIMGNRTPVMVVFGASWCAPSQAMDPVISDLALEFGDQVTFARCDIDSQTNLAQRYGVTLESIPVIILFNNDGELVEVITGMAPQSRIAESIKKTIKN